MPQTLPTVWKPSPLVPSYSADLSAARNGLAALVKQTRTSLRPSAPPNATLPSGVSGRGASAGGLVLSWAWAQFLADFFFEQCRRHECPVDGAVAR